MTLLTETATERPATLLDDYRRVRRFSERLAETLSPEDATLQSMTSASPTKWHLAHTTWFFETFLLRESIDYAPFDPVFQTLFNSYYNTVGVPYPRDKRGLLSRPSLEMTLDYRRSVDEHVERLLSADDLSDEQRRVMVLGLHHEQQHQELIVTDIKHALAHNPLDPIYREGAFRLGVAPKLEWLERDGGVRPIGHDGEGFGFDCEGPRHDALLRPHRLATRPVSCGEYLEFMKDRGYETPQLWLSDGWHAVQTEGWRAPLYWRDEGDGEWTAFTAAGRQTIDPAAPVCHVSYFEADAYARWAGARLPLEEELETATESLPMEGDFADTLIDAGWALHPQPLAAAERGLAQPFGAVWEWTASPFTAYPGYRPPDGALGEYNGKFMCNQFVLRGGSVATPSGHLRATYRNFFPATARWQFSGVRLAR
ncbi:ergothioneine biosynthesis protein EgtB [Botrimarina mediterranea]|uniref:Iron(II)-dependent oxidoreductase EgtB n=1 Tax=Botrimarina mediterranea TaxID=2528022 RepID=A0A518KCA8_9BACT|nr:ergothioneine biosynthesis protein EgtB [Botrimarina mediterranea]QDV75431.1 Iron(II)-dependent oxidoreductase EgtB [Botrimarina mediterranea]QDV80064.1 Iron(II)-dependent oxidoreductase EgtB [Planctomycetes bacterium K2D]